MSIHVLLLLTLVSHAAILGQRPASRLYLALSLAPLTRILSLSMPLSPLPIIYWYAVVSAPLLLAALVAVRVIGYSWSTVGLAPRKLPLQAGIALAGIPLGVVEYMVLRPGPLEGVTNWRTVLLAGVILLVGTGFVEELVFRGIMQQAALENWQSWGLVYVSVVFAVLHLGYLSALELAFVFAVGLLFAIVVARSGSIWGATFAHGVLNFALFVGVPLWLIPSLPEGVARWLEPPPERIIVELVGITPAEESQTLAMPVRSAFGYREEKGHQQPSEAATPTPLLREAASQPTPATPTAVLTPPATATATAAPSATPTATPTVGVTLVVRTPDSPGLNLREEPSLRGKIIQLLPDGTLVQRRGDELTKDGLTWWLVATEDGVSGWAAASYLSPAY